MVNRVSSLIPNRTGENGVGVFPALCRPESLEEFIGQSHLKALIRTAVSSARHRNAPFPHALISGAAGLGKTSIAKLIATEMGVDFVPTTAESLDDSAAVKGLLSRLDGSGHDSRGQAVGQIRPTVLFIDEAHRLNRHSQELLYSCIEDRVVDVRIRDPLSGLTKSVREWVPFFTLIAATNRPGDLTTSFRDRLRLNLRIESYGDKDSTQIARQSLIKMGLKCSPKTAALIAARGRGVPRRILGLCEQVRDIAVSKNKSSVSPAICAKAFDALGIDPLGLTRQDVEVLRYLAQSVGQPLGLQTLASLLGEDQRALEEAIEPFLLAKGLIARTQRGRTLTATGMEYLRQHHAFETHGRTLP